jgi:riboflavin kinase/FMN adenylyltransferase
MELIRCLTNLRSQHRGCVATIGNFDGLHLGHQAVLKQLKRVAVSLALPRTVITFEPHSQEYFQPDLAPSRLTRWREKFELLRAHGIDRMVCLRFDARLASLSARGFVEQVLVNGLGVRYLVVGDDFRFGKGREGDYAMLRVLAMEYGFNVVRAETFSMRGERVSSTRVRLALAQGDLETARRLLGRHYSISGRIVHGDKRGRTLGFATANINLHRKEPPVKGIFVVRVLGLAERELPGVAYIGSRPIISGRHNLLEVHIFDFDQECYGRYVRVELIKKLRDDKKFESFEVLKRQIAVDAECAKKVLEAV